MYYRGQQWGQMYYRGQLLKCTGVLSWTTVGVLLKWSWCAWVLDLVAHIIDDLVGTLLWEEDNGGTIKNGCENAPCMWSSCRQNFVLVGNKTMTGIGFLPLLLRHGLPHDGEGAEEPRSCSPCCPRSRRDPVEDVDAALMVMARCYMLYTHVVHQISSSPWVHLCPTRFFWKDLFGTTLEFSLQQDLLLCSKIPPSLFCTCSMFLT